MFSDVDLRSFHFDAEGGGGGGSSDSTDAAKGDAARAGSGEEGKASEEDLPFHEHPRWQEVHGDRKALRDVIGDMTPTELAAAMRDLREFYALMNEPDAAPKKEPPKPGTDEAKVEELRKGALEELERISPGITKTYARVESQFQALGRVADRETTKIMKELRYEEKDRGWLSKTFIEILNEREELWDDYITGNVKDAIRGANSVLQERLRIKSDQDVRAEKLRAAKTAKTMPRTHRPGGSADMLSGKVEPKATNIKDAGRAVQAKLEAMEE